jgi:4-hydroxy-2-oxoglutarate aldolase
MSKVLGGILAPVTTPFAAGSEALDLDGFAANLEAHLADGLDGIVVAGSTGEAALLTEEERVSLLAVARDRVPRDRWLVMGTGAESTTQCIARCVHAGSAGADAVLVVAPHYYANAMTVEALRAHFQRVADAAPVPVILYNIPKYMHFALSAALVAELAAHPNVIGIKDSSGDAAMLAGFLQAQGDAFTVLTGNGAVFHEALVAGARGGILAVSTFAAAPTRAVLAAHRAGDVAAGSQAQARLKPLAQVIVGQLGVPGVKAALDVVGRAGGVPRLPLLPLDAAGRETVESLLV